MPHERNSGAQDRQHRRCQACTMVISEPDQRLGFLGRLPGADALPRRADD